MMNKFFTAASLAGLMFIAGQANAALVVDTGTPDGNGFGYLISANDFIAGQVTFAQDLTINSIQTYLDAGNAGDSFTVSLYSDNGNKVGSLISSFDATYTGTGWNGSSALNQSVSAGSYWIGIEENAFATFVAVTNVATPLAHTAFADGSNLGAYQSADGMKFGLQVDAVAAVPEPESYAMLLAGLGLMGFMVRRRRND
jgi:hypothetical protein